MAGVVGQHFGHAQGADDGVALAHGHALDVPLGHRHQRLEQHVGGLLGHQRAAGQGTYRCLHRQAIDGQRIQQVGAGHHARLRMRGVVHQQAFHPLLAQARAGLGDAGRAGHPYRGRQLCGADLGHHQLGQFDAAGAIGQLALHRQPFLEPGGESRVFGQQAAE